MEFMKYGSIENSYQNGFIARWVNYYPELLSEKYILTEKIHGANFSVMITSDNIEYGKRTSKLQIHEAFFDWQNVVRKYESEFNVLQKYLQEDGIENIRLFGELFGSNIQKGVYYGNEKQLRFFDLYINDKLMSQEFFLNILVELNITHIFVPVIAIVNSLQEALEYDIKFNSTLIDLDDNICEGVVIKPFERVYERNDGNGFFYLKNKNKEFSEKQKTAKPIVDFSDSETFANVKEEFMSYINDNRLQSIFSKFGKISDTNQIGDYIKYLIADAREDFFKESMDLFLSLNDREKKKLFSSSSKEIVELLKRYL